MRILLLNGPNLNTLGSREPEIYGSETLVQIVARVETEAADLGASLVAFQSNHEGALIDFIQSEAAEAAGMIINPGALGHTGIGLRDAIAGSGLPAVEVHMSNVYARESFRQQLILSSVCEGVITGLGSRGYDLALTAIVDLLKERGKT